MVDLKPCPFCGGDKIWVAGPTCKASDPYNPLDRLYPIAQCRGCHAEVPGKNEDYSYNQRTAVSAWNTRPDASRISALEAERDRLREALATSELENSDLRAANDAAEMDAGLGNGNLWRFWSRKAREIAGKHSARAALGDDHD